MSNSDHPGAGLRSGRWLAAAVLAIVLAAPAAAQETSAWAKGSQWISLRAGYAKSGAEGAGDGNLGLGFGYTRFRNSKWAYLAEAEVNVLGRYGDAAEIEVPWTVGIARHFRLPTTVRPFLGLGGGGYYHKLYRTGADAASILPGLFLSGGVNAPLEGGSLLGLDVRMNVVRVDKPFDPVFGSLALTGEEQERVIHWGAKVTYSLTF